MQQGCSICYYNADRSWTFPDGWEQNMIPFIPYAYLRYGSNSIEITLLIC